MTIYSFNTAFRYYFAANLIVIPFFTKLYHYTTIFTTELHQIKIDPIAHEHIPITA